MYQLIKLSQGNNASGTRQQINPFLASYIQYILYVKDIQNNCKLIFFSKTGGCPLVSKITFASENIF